jgi:hypothetical protein
VPFLWMMPGAGLPPGGHRTAPRSAGTPHRAARIRKEPLTRSGLAHPRPIFRLEKGSARMAAARLRTGERRTMTAGREAARGRATSVSRAAVRCLRLHSVRSPSERRSDQTPAASRNSNAAPQISRSASAGSLRISRHCRLAGSSRLLLLPGLGRREARRVRDRSRASRRHRSRLQGPRSG